MMVSSLTPILPHIATTPVRHTCSTVARRQLSEQLSLLKALVSSETLNIQGVPYSLQNLLQ